MYRLVTSIETSIAFSTTLVFSMKLIKSVVSLRYDFCDLAIGWRRLSTNDEILSIGPSQPDMIGQFQLVLVCESLGECRIVVFAVDLA